MIEIPVVCAARQPRASGRKPADPVTVQQNLL